VSSLATTISALRRKIQCSHLANMLSFCFFMPLERKFLFPDNSLLSGVVLDFCFYVSHLFIEKIACFIMERIHFRRYFIKLYLLFQEICIKFNTLLPILIINRLGPCHCVSFRCGRHVRGLLSLVISAARKNWMAGCYLLQV